MSTAYSTSLYANKVPANGGFGPNDSSVHLHAISGSISTWALNDTINVGYLPRNAVVVSASIKAASQLDSNGAPTLTLDLGVVSATQLFKAAISTVGRAAGVTADQTLAATGVLYKNTTGADVAVLCTVHAAAATAVAGTLEFDLEYYVESTTASNP
jgi:hypothetical protein